MAAVEGMRVLVVGASSGIGRATALALRDAGALVVGAARRTDRIAELGLVAAVHCDLLDSTECGRSVEHAVAALGGLDALVSVAGLNHITPLAEAGYGTWRALLDTNLVGPALVTAAALPHLCAPGSQGRAVYVSSDTSEKPYPGMVLYASSKRALEAFAEGLHNEYPSIRSTHLLCGPTDDTEMMRDDDPEIIGPWLQRWIDEGYLRFGTQKSAAVARLIVDVLQRDDPPRQVPAMELGN